MTWKQAGRLLDMLGTIVLFLAFVLVSARACGGELPEPLRRIGPAWDGEASRVVNGHAEPLRLANADAEYVLYANPARPVVYEVSHFRVRPRMRTGWFAGRDYPADEAVYWMEFRAGDRAPTPRVFVRRAHRRWWSLWLLPHRRWEEVPAGSGRWLLEQGAAMRLWSVHALIHAYGRPAAEQEF